MLKEPWSENNSAYGNNGAFCGRARRAPAGRDTLSEETNLTAEIIEAKKKLILDLTRACTLGASIFAASAVASPETGTRENTGLKYWQWDEGGISVLIEQRLPDQTRAFFLARGFTSEAANVIGDGCVFKMDVRNPVATGSVIEYDLTQWQVIVDDEREPMMLKDQWDEKWRAMDLPSPPRIAFRWALLPIRQRLDPGDYNWGMSAFGFPAGTRFDLEFTWLQNGQRRSGTFRDLECAPDVESLVTREAEM